MTLRHVFCQHPQGLLYRHICKPAAADRRKQPCCTAAGPHPSCCCWTCCNAVCSPKQHLQVQPVRYIAASQRRHMERAICCHELSQTVTIDPQAPVFPQLRCQHCLCIHAADAVLS
jgi:hypothetical protein